jgi:hypothetical protein
VEADDVGVSEQPAKVVAAPGERRVRAERLREARCLAADPPGSHDQELLAVEARPQHELERELPLGPSADEPITLGDPAEEREHQADAELGRGAREDVRSVGHDDAPCGCSVEVDVVDADRVVRDDADLGACTVEIVGVDPGREGNEDPVGALGCIDELEVSLQGGFDLGRHRSGEMDARPWHERGARLVGEDARPVSGRVDVLAQNQPVLERENVDPVPLEPASVAVGGRGRPLADDEPVPRVETASPEGEIGPVRKDPTDVVADVVPFGPLAGGVVLEDHPRRVEGDDRVEIVRVPGLVVALDRSLELGGAVRRSHGASMAAG